MPLALMDSTAKAEVADHTDVSHSVLLVIMDDFGVDVATFYPQGRYREQRRHPRHPCRTYGFGSAWCRIWERVGPDGMQPDPGRNHHRAVWVPPREWGRAVDRQGPSLTAGDIIHLAQGVQGGRRSRTIWLISASGI